MKKRTIRIAEIFSSISGEVGLIPQGSPATFIRTQGCNLKCAYCDTPQTIPDVGGFEMTSEDVVSRVTALGNERVIITGGEPGIWDDEMSKLIEVLKPCYTVQVETNGTIDGGIFNHAACVVFDFKEGQNPMTFVTNVLGYAGNNWGRGNEGPRTYIKLPVTLATYKKRIDEVVRIEILLSKIGDTQVMYAISPLAGESIYQQVFDYVFLNYPEVFQKNLVYNFQIHKAMNLA